VCFVTYNTSGKPQLFEFLCVAQVEVGDHSRLIAIGSQEHHQRGTSLQLFKEKLSRDKWKCLATPACDGPTTGSAAGTSIIAPAGRAAIGQLPGLGFDTSPVGAEGRITTGFVECSAFPFNGVLFSSVYAFHSQMPTSLCNRLIFDRLASITLGHKGPTIICGDWQVNPSTFKEHMADWLEKTGLVVIAPAGDTFKTGGCYDYFLVSRVLVDFISRCFLFSGFAPRMHCPVGLEFLARICNPILPCLRQISSFGREAPMLPRRFHQRRDTDLTYIGVLDELQRGGVTFTQTGLDNAYVHMCNDVEVQLCVAFDAMDNDNQPDRRYLGRGDGREYIANRSPIPNMSYSFGALNFVQLGLFKFLEALQCYHGSLGAMVKGYTFGRAQALAAHRRRLVRPSGALAAFLRGNLVWDWALDDLLNKAEAYADLVVATGRLVGFVRRSLVRETEANRLARSSGYRAWQQDQLRGGAAALHGICRPTETSPDEALPIAGTGPP